MSNRPGQVKARGAIRANLQAGAQEPRLVWDDRKLIHPSLALPTVVAKKMLEDPMDMVAAGRHSNRSHAPVVFAGDGGNLVCADPDRELVKVFAGNLPPESERARPRNGR